jgi:hypothetical protein
MIIFCDFIEQKHYAKPFKIVVIAVAVVAIV